ncbi:hypothetical protein M9H77_08358 [Catharanthus roseus]|uniref:Uncharacterized protein n=1 Tax=Catharanthus roseus TaxID=4058 RepID=A0ACC0BXJ0_CATRO|nr:hypothetical protein M9H77_08358 [Catharanthus roseus]
MVQNITQHLVEVMKPLIRNELYFAKEQEQKEARQNQQPMTSQVVSAIAPNCIPLPFLECKQASLLTLLVAYVGGKEGGKNKLEPSTGLKWDMRDRVIF